MRSKLSFSNFVAFAFLLLWLYAALSKLSDYTTFQTQLRKSPMLTAIATPVAKGVPVIELLLAYLLSFSKTRTIGLYGSLFLMSMFTTYLIIILNYSYYIPCSCGGILGHMDWSTHIVFNIACAILAILALLLPAPKRPSFYTRPLHPAIA